MRITERLRALSGEIKELETEAGILAEQLEFQTDVAEDARIRALVSETPLADRDAREAKQDLERMQRSFDDVRRRVQALRDEQDRLLEALAGRRG